MITEQNSKWHDGWKTFTGVAIVVIVVLASFTGDGVRDLFPVSIARFGEQMVLLLGSGLAFYGRLKAKGKTWFQK